MKSFFCLINISLFFLVFSNYKSFAGSNVQFFNGAKVLTLCKDTNAINQSVNGIKQLMALINLLCGVDSCVLHPISLLIVHESLHE